MIKISVSAADAVLTQTETLTAGMVSLPTVQFTFTSDWDNLGKTAVIRAGAVTEELLVTNNQITVPATCMANAGVNLIIGVWGGDQTVELPTVWCACGEILEGTDPTEASNHTEATSSNVAQMLGYADEIEQLATEMATNIIRTVSVNTTNANRYGTVQVAIADSGAGANRTLTFTFANLKGNGIESLTFTESGDYKGRLQVRLSDGTVTNFDAFIEVLSQAADAAAAETLRVAAESLRVSAEEARVLAESGRVSAEEGRVLAEQGRVDAESARVTAETARVATEQELVGEVRVVVNNEANRVSAETERVANETTRQTKESERLTNEDSRVAAEATRAANETARQNNETARIAEWDEWGDIVSDAEAYARGSRDGEPVSSDDPAYHNNSKYYSEQSATSAAAAEAAARSLDIDAFRDQIEGFIAPQFLETEPYDAGESVFQDDVLYTFLVDHDPGPWDLTEVELATTMQALENKVDKEQGKGLSTEDYTSAEKTKLSGIETGAQVNTLTGVKGDSESSYRTGNVNITPANIGLGNVNNTSDADKPISTATQTALNALPATVAPLMDGTAAVGSSTRLAKEDHVHPSDTAKENVSNKRTSWQTTPTDTAYPSEKLTKDSIDAQSRRIDAVMNETKSLSGAVVTFDDGVEGAPLKSCIVNVTAVQAGTGDPSPTNVRAITGWTEANLYRAGKNLISTTVDKIKAINTRGTWNGNAYTDSGVTFTLNVDDNGNVLSINLNGTNTSQARVSELVIPTNAPVGSLIMTGVEAAATEDYYIGTNVSGSSQYLRPNTSGGYISVTTTASNHSGLVWCAVTRLKTVSNAVFKPMLRYASVSDATYEPFGKQFVAQFGDTYYGGQYNYLTGLFDGYELVPLKLSDMTFAKYTIEGRNCFYCNSANGQVPSNTYTPMRKSMAEAFKLTYVPVSSLDDNCYTFSVYYSTNYAVCIRAEAYDSVEAFLAAVGDTKVLIPRGHITAQLTPQEVTLLAGSNTIWADCGNVSIEYGGYIGSLEDAIARLTARVAALENA